jgi:hypothetical protein
MSDTRCMLLLPSMLLSSSTSSGAATIWEDETFFRTAGSVQSEHVLIGVSVINVAQAEVLRFPQPITIIRAATRPDGEYSPTDGIHLNCRTHSVFRHEIQVDGTLNNSVYTWRAISFTMVMHLPTPNLEKYVKFAREGAGTCLTPRLRPGGWENGLRQRRRDLQLWTTLIP